jgi:predicted kinase
VRAQVEQLRDPHGGTARRYLDTALAWARPGQPRVVITFGLPGSGKTFASQQLLEREGAIRLRSDVERKRLFGLGPHDDSRAQGLDLYGADANLRTYRHLFAVAGDLLRAGLPVVLDAAFLRRSERTQARDLARAVGVPMAILACEVPDAVTRARLASRTGDASEADLTVFERLRQVAEPLDADERACVQKPGAA